MKTWIGVLDCNNFFVSCERLFRPDLRNKPVVVLSSNDGCVVARSQEVKDMNVPMGVPYFKIKDTLKKADSTTFSSHFALYRDISRRVFEVMRDELENVEQYSIDEAFFLFKGSEKAVSELAKRVRAAVELQVGIPVSVGVGYSKTQAKYANFLAKKSKGVCVLNSRKWLKIAPEVPLSRLWGVGRRLDLNYKKHGLLTVADVLTADNSRLDQLFGIVGMRLKQELSGVAIYGFEGRIDVKQSITSSRSFGNTTNDLPVLADALAYHTRHALVDLRAMARYVSVVTVSIGTSRYGDFLLKGRSKKIFLEKPTNDTLVVLKEVNKALVELFESGVPYKKAGVTLSQFSPIDAYQNSLFSNNNESVTQSLMPVLDSINLKAGREVVLVGSRLQSNNWQSLSDSKSPAYTTRWKDLFTVKAK
ncbi:Y-family DNA polymerase [Candidatus Nomurabacteria bacterium]|nr:Y-family DNA polymerase [Candidatus Kaiserbacteria bacterium]MCB9813859.1 Y-family DNA polymerase [Candidatus Nomurabacteria bacterium]